MGGGEFEIWLRDSGEDDADGRADGGKENDARKEGERWREVDKRKQRRRRGAENSSPTEAIRFAAGPLLLLPLAGAPKRSHGGGRP